MTTPFWQIRNRSFLNYKLEKRGLQNNNLYKDFTRGIDDIYINGRTLRSIYKGYLEEDSGQVISANALSDKIKGMSIEQIKTIISKELLKFAQPKDKLRFTEQLSSIFYQSGILYTCGQSIVEHINLDNTNSYIAGSEGFDTTVHIYEKNGNINVEEKVKLNYLTNMEVSDQNNQLVKLKNTDGTPLAIFKNRFKIKPLGPSKDDPLPSLGYRHQDLTIEYNNNEARSYLDKRSIFTKIKDFFKSIFRMNGIKKYSINKLENKQDNEQPSPKI